MLHAGALYCWSFDDVYGQTQVPAGLGPVVKVSLSYYHACAISANTSLATCWSSDPFTNLQYGATAVPAGLGAVVDVCAMEHASCAVRANGTIRW